MSISSEEELEGLKRIGKIVRMALEAMKKHVRVGVSTADLDKIGEKVLEENNARSAPMALYDYPAATCISTNDEIVHGVPGERIVQEGDLVKLDVTAEKDGFIADAAITVPVGLLDPVHQKLMDCTKVALEKALEIVKPGARIREIGRVVEKEAKKYKFGVIKELCGHGVGRHIHEDPKIPNNYNPWNRERLTDGLVITIEPMITVKKTKAIEDEDGWTMRTKDGSFAAHFEHSLVVTKNGPLLLTA